MKTFCRGILSTPKLQKISYEGMEVENKGNDLNKAIQGLYKKKNQDISLDLKLLTLKDVNSTKICYNRHPTSFYQNLTHLILWKCGNIKYVFPSSIAKSLHQLQQLKIQNCKVLEEIVAKEGASAVVDFVFPNITLLKLEDLPKLTVFYPGIYTLEMPKLKELEVRYCTKYLSFTENNAETECATLDPKSIFLNNVINFNLEVFKLYDGVTNICWQSQFETLRIDKDTSTNIPLRLLQRFENVRELRLVSNQYKDIKSPYDLLNLEDLYVYFHNRLTSLVPFLVFSQNLKVLTVSSCNRLMKLITPLVAKSLVQLRELSISSCEMLTEIVEIEGDATNTGIAFDNLSKLSLKHLESLTCFCSRNYSINFPSLEEVIINECPNMKTFSQGTLSTPKLHNVKYHWKWVDTGENNLNTIIQQKHKNEVGSFWKKMTLSGRDIMTILQGEFQENFVEIETLQLIKDDYAYIPIHIFKKFINLEKLILKVSSYEEIFSNKEGEEHVETLSKLKDLILQGLSNLNCIWKQNFQFKSILQNLHSLNVTYCDSLMTLLPPSSTFKSLTILAVKHCNGMQNLMTSSTAKSLIVQSYGKDFHPHGSKLHTRMMSLPSLTKSVQHGQQIGAKRLQYIVSRLEVEIDVIFLTGGYNVIQ
ncbi:uncharacterized protein LOC123208470 [Mangifera indica]|uniref:uncharacterized protein LOC123208470 n=1 Tax=Mangifera indica TaxID=29780 RepID=UPI001CFC3C53|nr:uncharacterized protein LOC123208470 [Mangifera indica]